MVPHEFNVVLRTTTDEFNVIPVVVLPLVNVTSLFRSANLLNIERLLLIAEKYIVSVEELHASLRSIPPHGASFQGQPLNLVIICEAHKAEFRIQVFRIYSSILGHTLNFYSERHFPLLVPYSEYTLVYWGQVFRILYWSYLGSGSLSIFWICYDVLMDIGNYFEFGLDCWIVDCSYMLVKQIVCWVLKTNRLFSTLSCSSQVHYNESVGSVRQKIARKMKLPVEQIQFQPNEKLVCLDIYKRRLHLCISELLVILCRQ